MSTASNTTPGSLSKLRVRIALPEDAPVLRPRCMMALIFYRLLFDR
jgi:hypothetical protein